MDKNIIRQMIVNYRDEDGLTFQAISDVLNEKYGIKKDRQSVYGIYKRAKDKGTKDNDMKYNPEMVVDIINLNIRGYNKTRTLKILRNTYKDIRYSTVTNVLNEREYVESIKSRVIFNIIDSIKNGVSDKDLENSLKYKDNEVLENGFNDLVSSAYAMLIMSKIKGELVQAYNFRSDWQLIKDIIEKTKVDVQINDLKSRV